MDMGMDMGGFRISDTGPVAVDMSTSDGSVALWISDSSEGNVSAEDGLMPIFLRSSEYHNFAIGLLRK